MTTLLDQLLEWTTQISGWIWGAPMVVLLLGTGLYFTFRTLFVQIRFFPEAIRSMWRGAMGTDQVAGEKRAAGDITPFQALMTALSSTVGNGNIAGVATAIAAGGPGAVFWMWLTAVVGMATNYAEAVLAVLFRVRFEDGSVAGGPMFYCRYGIRNEKVAKVAAAVFAVAGILATLLGTGNMFQSQSMALAAKEQFGLPTWVTGLTIAFLSGVVIIGGITRIGRVAERLVPTMILLYFGGALFVILNHLPDIPEAFRLIFVTAFEPQAVFGGAVGIGIQQAIRFGVARGLLSNEAGLGSSPIAHGAARTRYPLRQGSIAMMGVFIDTIVVCSITALAIILSGAYRESALLVPGGLTGADLTVTAFNTGMPEFVAGWGGIIVVCSSLLFGFTTLLGWSYYGQVCCEYLFGIRSVQTYRVVFIILVVVGSLLTGKYAPIITNVGDIFNAVMAFPNLLALLALGGIVARVTRAAYRAGSIESQVAEPREFRG
ncbi:MAG: sodium:alanine symporter family protein [Acidobacteriota bacterium]